MTSPVPRCVYCCRRLICRPSSSARRLSRLAAEQGLARQIDNKAPYKWLRGSVPRHPWPALAAHELSRQLGIQVTAGDLGWPEASADGPSLLPADTGLDQPWTVAGALTAVSQVSDQQVGVDRLFLPLSGTALTMLAMDWLTADSAGDPACTEGRRIGMEQAEDLEHITARLRRMDGRHGGGLVLPVAQDYARNATDILHRYSYIAAVGLRLWAAVADLHGLIGWLCYDAGHPALAQRYWIAGLRAAHAADDRAIGASILASLSGQASEIGQPNEAIYLARAAQRGHVTAGPRLAAVISFAVARAHASGGDAEACHAAINAARRALDATNPDISELPAADWLDAPGARAQIGTACLYLREYQQAQKYLTAALRGLDPVGRARDIAVIRVRLALAYVGQHHPERACESASRVVSVLAEAVDSSRCVRYLREVCEALRLHRRRPAVAALIGQVDKLFSQG